jgi:hypothetical protein
MKTRSFTLAEAARRAGVPEEELRTALKDGLILGRRLDHTGVEHIDEAELNRYLKRSRNLDLSDLGPLRRILIIDDDPQYAESLLLVLKRDARIDSRTATWGKDAIGLLHAYKPHLCLLGWPVPPDSLELTVEVLGMRGIKEQTRVLVYGSSATREDPREDVAEGMRSFGVSRVYSKARGVKDLVAECYAALGLDEASAPPRKKAPPSA